MRSELCLAMVAVICAGCSCGTTHVATDAGFDAALAFDAGPHREDAGRDAGVDAGGVDAGVDAAGPVDAGFSCPPNPLYWDADGGFLTSDGDVNPYCEGDGDCPFSLTYDDNQSCYDGVCCNGRFDTDTCTCTCGTDPFDCGFGRFCCVPRDETQPRCVSAQELCQGSG